MFSLYDEKSCLANGAELIQGLGALAFPSVENQVLLLFSSTQIVDLELAKSLKNCSYN